MAKEKLGATNVTIEKLTGLPFENARELKEAQEELRLRVWRRLEEAKIIDELLQRGEYKFWSQEFKEGLTCSYGEKEENLVRVFSDGKGIKININRALAESSSSSEELLGVLVKSMSESFATTYYKAKGILPITDSLDPDGKPKKDKAEK